MTQCECRSLAQWNAAFHEFRKASLFSKTTITTPF